MSQQELLRKVIGILSSVGIDYMLTGSVVSSLQGEPRSTHDIDVLMTVGQLQVDRMAEVLTETEFYVSRTAIADAVAHHGMFNAIDRETSSKIDFWVLSNDEFDTSRFSRRMTREFHGIQMTLSSPEDTILAKLRWAKLSGGSEKQFIDALRVYEVQHDSLDAAYIERWIGKLELQLLWERLKEQAEPA